MQFFLYNSVYRWCVPALADLLYVAAPLLLPSLVCFN